MESLKFDPDKEDDVSQAKSMLRAMRKYDQDRWEEEEKKRLAKEEQDEKEAEVEAEEMKGGGG